MKRTITILLLTMLLSNWGVAQNMEWVRQTYRQGVQQEAKALELLKYLGAEPNTPLVMGYQGATHVVMAKHFVNPFSKYNSFKKGRHLLDEALKRSPNELELIFLRYTIQVHAPSFLGYHHALKQDNQLLYNLIIQNKIQDLALRKRIIRFFLESPKIDAAQRKTLQQYE